MIILRLFWNYQEHRLRAFWRLVGQIVVFVAVMLLLTLLVGQVLVLAFPQSATSKIAQAADSPEFTALNAVATLLATLGSLWIAGRLLDRRTFAGFGFRLSRVWWGDLAFGLGLGALLMTGIFLVELAAGWVTIQSTFQTAGSGQSFALAFVTPLVLFVCVGIYEEALSRGYLLRNLSEGLNFHFLGRRGAIILAWLVSSAIFGAMHLGNPNSTAVSTANLMIAGLFLGLGILLTGELAIPIGLHITWNLFQGNVYGFPVSGAEFNQTTFIAVAQGGPDWLTGGAFGPEAGVLGLIAMVVGAVLILWRTQRRRGRLAFDPHLAHPPTR